MSDGAPRPSSLVSLRGLLGLGSGFALLLLWAGVAYRIATDPGNHVSVSPLGALPLALVAVLAGANWWAAHLRRAGLALLVLGLGSGVGLVLLDRLDILVGYEDWLERGMPDRPF